MPVHIHSSNANPGTESLTFLQTQPKISSSILLEVHMAAMPAGDGLLGTIPNTTKKEVIGLATGANGGSAGPGTDVWAFLQMQPKRTSSILLEARMASTRDRERTLGIPSITTKEELIELTRDAYGGSAGRRTDSLAFLHIQPKRCSSILLEAHSATTRVPGRSLLYFFKHNHRGVHRFC